MGQLSKKKLIIIGLIILLAIAIIRFSDLLNFFSLENLKNHREYLQTFVSQHYFLSVLIYSIICILVVATTLPLSAFMFVSAGFLFGMKWGVVYSNLSATIGALISFIALRYVFGKTLPEKLKIRLAPFSQDIKRYGALYFLILHLMSILPFFLINALAVITNLPLFTFIWTTLVGIIPIALLYNYMGEKIGIINSIQDVLTPPVISSFVGLIILAILPILITKLKNKR